ncbi:MAG: LCP family protein [Phototrophicaceae bacterium]
MTHQHREKTSSLWRSVIHWLFVGGCVVGIAWFGRDLLQVTTQYLVDRQDYLNHQEAYHEQAQRISSPPSAMSAHIQLVSGNQAQVFATNTPKAENPTDLITSTPTPMPPVERFELPTLVFPEDAPTDLQSPTQIPTRIPPITRNHDLVNIAILGSDQEVAGDNTIRTDTMIIVSINRDTGTVSMLSLPRDLFVYIPSLGMQRLTVAFGRGENYGWTGGGFGLFRDTMIYNFGINVHFYAKVDITGLEGIIDLLGGVNVAVDCAIQDYYPIKPIEELDLTKDIFENYQLRTMNVGYYHLDGFDAQWYARSRKNSSDFDRGRRQQQLLRAIFRQALDGGQLTNLPALWNQGIELVETDMTLNQALSLLPLALTLDDSQIESFTLIPTYHTQSWTVPDDGSNVQLPVYDTLIPLLEDFYTPPADSQVDVQSATVRVLNATTKPFFDYVGSERLRSEGFNAFPDGNASELGALQTTIIDRSGQTKGSRLLELQSILNVPNENILIEPDPNRLADYEVILGETYHSCEGGVLEVEPTTWSWDEDMGLDN